MESVHIFRDIELRGLLLARAPSTLILATEERTSTKHLQREELSENGEATKSYR